MFKKLKAIYNKQNYDFSKGSVDPKRFHKTFYFMLKAFQVLDDEPIPKWTYFSQFIIVMNTSFLLFMVSLSLYHGIETFDLLLVTEMGTYCIMFVYKTIILSSTKLNLEYYHKLLNAMREDFHYVCTKGTKYRNRFFDNQLETWKICLSCCGFLALATMGMASGALALLLFFVYTQKPGDNNKRPELVSYWAFNVDFTQSPVYEISSAYTIYSVLLYGYSYVFMIQTGIVWIRHIAAKADLIIYCLQDLMQDIHPTTNARKRDKLLKLRLRDIVKQHLSMYRLMQDFAEVYKKFLMFEQKFGGPVVCLTAYCSLEKLSAGEFHAILTFLCITVMTVVYIPSFFCTFLGIKVRSICDACWDIPFWNCGNVVRPYLVLIMQRSLRPLPLQAPGFEDISLQTFSNKMASAYSLFNMLRQTNFGNSPTN